MRDLNHDLKLICRRNRDGSFATQADRERILALVANALHALGFKNLRATSLKPKHVGRLVDAWKTAKLSAGAIKNRMSAMRWWAEKIGKPNIMARSNDAYGIERRVFVTNVSKARELSSDDLAKISDTYTHASLRLQAAFGLRREESIKFQPAWADRGDRIVLKASWAKGGKERVIPVRTLKSDGWKQCGSSAEEWTSFLDAATGSPKRVHQKILHFKKSDQILVLFGRYTSPAPSTVSSNPAPPPSSDSQVGNVVAIRGTAEELNEALKIFGAHC
jgi:hypothetical protein